MKKQFVCAAVAAVFTLMSAGAEDAHALLAKAQGKPSIKPTAPTGTSLYSYQLNCDPGFPTSVLITFGFTGPTVGSIDTIDLTDYLVVGDIVGIAPYFIPNINLGMGTLKDAWIAQLNDNEPSPDGLHQAQIYGEINPTLATQLGFPAGFPTNPLTGEPEPDVYGIQFDTTLLQEIVNSLDLDDTTQQNLFFTFYAGGGTGDNVVGSDNVTYDYSDPVENRLFRQISVFDLLAGSGTAAVPLPSVGIAGLALLPMTLLRRRRQTAGAPIA